VLRTGDEIEVHAEVKLGELIPDDVAVELYHGPISDQEVITEAHTEKMEVQDSSNGVHVYKGTIICQSAGRYGFSVRVAPGHYALPHHLIPERIVWA